MWIIFKIKPIDRNNNMINYSYLHKKVLSYKLILLSVIDPILDLLRIPDI
jgi:hypothetical protein